jgi:hypothetical protein
MTRELLQVLEGKGNGCIKSISLSEIEFPAPASVREGECLSQMIEKVAAGDFFGAEGFAAFWG